MEAKVLENPSGVRALVRLFLVRGTVAGGPRAAS